MSDHISYSQIETYLRCPFLYGLQQIRRLRPPASGPLLFGRAVHHTLHEYGLYYKEVGGHDPGVIAGLWGATCQNSEVTPRPMPYDSYVSGRTMLTSLIESGKFGLDQAIELETEFLVDFGGVNVKGIIDRIDEIGTGMFRIVDYKAGGAFYSGEAVEKSLQLSIYAAALEEILGESVSFISVGIHQLNQNMLVERQKSLAEIDDTKAYVVDLYHRIKSDSKLQATPGSACLRYGGCWAAYDCPEHQNVILEGIDLSQASGSDLLRMYTQVEIRQKLLKEALKGKLDAEDEISFGGRVARLTARRKYVANEDALRQLIRDFGVDPFSFMNLDSRRLPRAVDAASALIAESERTEEEKAYLLGKLGELVRDAYSIETGTPQIKLSTEK